MGRPAIDRTGHTYGHLIVLGRAHAPSWDANHVFWACRCLCGKIIRVRTHHLTRGQQSCGCLTKAAVIAAHRKHGMHDSSEYDIWAHIVQRCCNPASPLFKRYGGKGLTMSPVWRADFSAFYRDMGPRPPHHSIDRIDNSKGYYPENCRWATHGEQNRNRSLSHWITWDGRTLTVSEWARELRASRNTIKNRWASHRSLAPILRHRTNF